MKRFFWLLAVMGAVLLSAAPGLADDGFYVIGGRPAVGTRICSLPYEITAPGYYYLTGNITCPAGKDGITVTASNVTIDLMGFCLNGPTGSWVNTGINIKGQTNVEIRNGRMTFWGGCIIEEGGTGHRVINVRVQCFDSGVNLGGSAHLIKGCTAYNCIKGLTVGNGTISDCIVIGYASANYGISSGGGTITRNLVQDCPTNGIIAGGETSISHNQVSNCGTGISGAGGGSIVGNVVFANNGQTGVLINDGNMLDQNSSSGNGNHLGYATGATSWWLGLNGF